MTAKVVVLLVFLLVSSLAVVAPSFSSEPVRVYVDPPAVIDPDVLFNVSVNVENLVNLAGLQWELTWDPAILRAVDITEIMFHEATPQSEWDNIWRIRQTIDNELGVAYYAYTFVDGSRATEGGYRPITGNHTSATISFQVLAIGNCTMQLTRSETKLADPDGQPIEHNVTDGFFSNSVLPPTLPPVPTESSQVLIYADPRRVRNESLAVNETFTIAVKMDSITNHSGIIQSLFGLSWNSTLLECIDVTEVMFHETLPETEWQNLIWRCSIDNNLGEIGLIALLNLQNGQEYLSAHAVFGNHTLVTITFKVKSTGTCTLHLHSCVFRELNVMGDQMLYSTVDGYFANTLNGDLNGDATVDLLDAIVFARSYGAYWNGSGWNEGADINGDMQIDVFDAILLGKLFGHTR